jgi:serine/threonine protein kinase/tetratricopeptide (TPR) repeat protein
MDDSGNGGSSGRDGLPEILGAYRILSLLGRGGMGEVFLAWDPGLKRRVAIKRIRQDLNFTPIQRERLLREAQAAANLSHPAIVGVYQMLQDEDGNDCIVMEHVEGPTLAAALLKQGPWQPLLAVRLAREIASGLATAHAGGIIHRDLKTENVMLTLSGHAKILDFGLAKPILPVKGDMTLTEAHCVVGTCRSMSPEQARHEELDERSDLFSLGVLLYEMLTGKPPFHAASAVGTLAQVLSHHPLRVNALQPGIPQRLSVLVARLLEKDPACRPQSAEEVIQELATIEDAAAPSLFPSSQETISELPTGAYRPPSKPPSDPIPRTAVAPESTGGMSVRKRHRRLGTAAFVVLAVLALAGLAIAWDGIEPTSPPTPVLRVRVLKLRMQNQADPSSLAAFDVLTTILNTLNSFEKVEAIDATQLVEPLMARAGVEDESLVAQLDAEGNQWKVTLSRGRPYGQPTTPDIVASHIATGDFVRLSQEVSSGLFKAYPDRLRPGIQLAVHNEDYIAFLAISKRIEDGTLSPADDLVHLDQVTKGSPLLLEARLLAAEILLTTYQSNNQIDKLDGALNLVKGAQDLAPHDTRPLTTKFKIDLAGNQPNMAADTLERIKPLLPPDSPRFLALKASLEEKQSRPRAAIADSRQVAEFSPTWRNLISLAKVEQAEGKIPEARAHLQKIRLAFPRNFWALLRLAHLELGYGDPKLAEQLWLELIELDPQHKALTNLGVAQILSRQYSKAITTLSQVLETDKDEIHGNLTLGEAELAQGSKESAERHFQTALDEIDKNKPAGGLSTLNSLLKAQCLAYLGRKKEAVRVVQNASLPDGEALLYAAQVYAILGDQDIAFDKANDAIEKGVAPNWFRLPAFDPLRNDPDFRKLLDNPPGAPTSR